MTKRLSRAVKKRKRTDWKAAALRLRVEVATLTQDWNKWHAEWEHEFNNKMKLEAELARYRLICYWACQRIEKLEAVSSDWEASWLKAAHCCHKWVETALERSKEITKLREERRILLDTLFEVHAENIMQGEDILRQRDELIKLRGEPAERISL